MMDKETLTLLNKQSDKPRGPQQDHDLFFGICEKTETTRLVSSGRDHHTNKISTRRDHKIWGHTYVEEDICQGLTLERKHWNGLRRF